MARWSNTDADDDYAGLTGISEPTALLRAALTALVQQAAGRRLALLGGSDKDAAASPRRRSRQA